MSIVDTWDWDKIDTSVYDETIKMTADMKVRTALLEFYEHYGIWSNKIIMGYRLVDELRREFFGAVATLEEVKAVGLWHLIKKSYRIKDISESIKEYFQLDKVNEDEY